MRITAKNRISCTMSAATIVVQFLFMTILQVHRLRMLCNRAHSDHPIGNRQWFVGQHARIQVANLHFAIRASSS
jgi:hypothetical protein